MLRKRIATMSRTYTSLHYHVIFGTKDRVPFLQTSWRARLHEYLGGVVSGLGAQPQGIGGVADPVHLLLGLRATHCLSDVVREIKKASNAWIREEMREPLFSWQEGYAAFTVSATSREGVIHYIANQEQHHRRRDYRAELIDMLKIARVDFDAEYIG